MNIKIDNLFFQIRWLGHVRQTDDIRISKAMLYGELMNGSRARGSLKLSFKNVIKNEMKHIGMDINTLF